MGSVADEQLTRVALRPHPSSTCDAVRALAVELGLAAPTVLAVGYEISGDLDRLRIPDPDAGLDPARLWEHTCFELFVAHPEDEPYVEHNLSPSGQHAVFGFSAYRQRVADPPLSAESSIAVAPGRISLRATVSIPAWAARGARIAPTAVIEDAEGGLSYWALHHPGARPDFHHRDGFVLSLAFDPSPTITLRPRQAP